MRQPMRENDTEEHVARSEPYALPPSQDVIYEDVPPANWENRLTSAIVKLKEKQSFCQSYTDQLRNTNNSIKELREEYAKEKKHYSEAVNRYAQQLHESIMRYEAGRERKERFTERQQILTAEYEKLSEKGHTIQRKELAVGHEKRAKAEIREQMCLCIMEQLERVRIAYLEQQRRQDELFNTRSQLLTDLICTPMERHIVDVASTQGDGDEFTRFCTNFLLIAKEVNENSSFDDPQTLKIREMRDKTMAFLKELNDSFLSLKAKAEQQATEAKSLVCDIQSAENDAEAIQNRIVELAGMLQQTD